jgi:hypothetical protein
VLALPGLNSDDFGLDRPAPAIGFGNDRPRNVLSLLEMLMLLEGIELSTSPLPRECSTTELQQHTANFLGFCENAVKPLVGSIPDRSNVKAAFRELKSELPNSRR